MGNRTLHTNGEPATAPRRALFISYTFPPTGGAGVQRVTKFVKYLPRHGWAVSVLTVDNPSVPVTDDSLLHDVPPETLLVKAKTYEPGYALKQSVAAGGRNAGSGRKSVTGMLKSAVRRVVNGVLQPDVQVLWLPRAVRQGLRHLRSIPHDVIVATAPPFTDFVVGRILSQRTGLPLVLDYRDEWDLTNTYAENRQVGRLALAIQRRIQHKVLRAASAVIATTPASAERIDRVRLAAGSQATSTYIYNGFDPADFKNDEYETPAGDTIRLTYTGTLWNLTSVEPLVRAVQQLSIEAPHLAGRLELTFVGRRTADQDALVNELSGSGCRTRMLPYMPHSAVIAEIRGADILCVLLSDVPGAERVMPAKVFECLAAGRRILAIAPPGELTELLKASPHAACHHPLDVAGIVGYLRHQIESTLGQRIAAPFDGETSPFNRRVQAGQLAELLNRVAGSR